jgi:transcriptional regulator with XRE-family HTH domain
MISLVQCRMGRAALNWSVDELGAAAGLNRRTVLRFEAGETVSPETVEALRHAMETQKVRFVMNGPEKGGVIPPPRKPLIDHSARNPLLPKGKGSRA